LKKQVRGQNRIYVDVKNDRGDSKIDYSINTKSGC